VATESAITENLVNYATKAWAAGDEVQAFAGNQLRSMIQNFLAGARGKGNELDVDLGYLRSVLTSIDERLAGTALEARDRDAWVKQIAELFRAAGTEGNMPRGHAFGTERPIIYTVDSDALRGYQLAQNFEGNATLRTMRPDGSLYDGQAMLKELDTPEAIAGFVNALTPNQVRLLLDMPGGTDVVVKALRTGKLTTAAAKNLTDWMFNPEINRDTRFTTLRTIAADPAAAAGLVRLLEKDPDLFSRFLTGEGWNADRIPSAVPREEWGKFTQQFLRMLTTAAPKLSDTELTRVAQLLSEKLPNSPTWEVVKKLEPDLTAFLVAAAPLLLGPPDGSTRKDLKDWVDRFGTNLNLLMLNDWLNNIAANEKDGQQKRNVLLENMLIGIVGAIPLLKVPSAIANVLLSGGWGGFGGVVVQPWLDSLIHYPGQFDLKRSLRVVAFASMIAQLAKDGQIQIGKDRPDFETIQKDPDFKAAIDAFANGAWSTDARAQAWAESLGLEPSDLDTEWMIDALNSRFPPEPKE